nr:SGNH/GDSL hydrolase family protein [Rhodococcus sp. (in: high G+C Gram-positive bacteria)]
MSSRTARFLIATLTALIATSALSSGSVAAAQPAAGKRLVTMGDSFTATTPLLADKAGCAHPETSWPAQLAGSIGVAGTADFLDVSCNGGSIDTGTGWTLLQQAREAAKQGAFGTSTKAVLLQVGLNDTWGSSRATAFPSVDCLIDVVRGCGTDAVADGRVPDAGAVTGPFYADRIRPVVDYIRFYAPNARIGVVGYPEIFPSGQSSACLELPGNGRVNQARAEGYISFLDRLDEAQRGAAAALGIDFVDTRALTAGHGSCADDSWVGGLTDPDSLRVGAPIHPTPRGNAVLAGALRNQFAL